VLASECGATFNRPTVRSPHIEVIDPGERNHCVTAEPITPVQSQLVNPADRSRQAHYISIIHYCIVVNHKCQVRSYIVSVSFNRTGHQLQSSCCSRKSHRVSGNFPVFCFTYRLYRGHQSHPMRNRQSHCSLLQLCLSHPSVTSHQFHSIVVWSSVSSYCTVVINRIMTPKSSITSHKGAGWESSYEFQKRIPKN
jgi:hypothetical protein